MIKKQFLNLYFFLTLIAFGLSSENKAIAEVTSTNDLNNFTTQKQYIKNSIPGSIAVVDLQYIMDHFLEVHNIKKKIEELSSKIREEENLKEDEFLEEEKTIMSKKDKLSPIEFDTSILEFNNAVSLFQKSIREKKSILEKIYSENISKVHDAATEIITKLAQEKELDIVIPVSQTLFFKERVDITKEVIKSLEKKDLMLKFDIQLPKN